MTRTTLSARRRRQRNIDQTTHVPHWSWTRREPEPQGHAATLAPEDFWSRLGL